MSMIYCHEHNLHVDTDFHEECPECLAEIDEVVHESPLVEILHPSTKVHNGYGFIADSWRLCCHFTGTDAEREACREVEGWRVVYGSSDMLKVMEDALSFNANHSNYYKYAIKAPGDV